MNSEVVATLSNALGALQKLVGDTPEVIAAFTALEEAAGWEMVQPYSEIYPVSYDGERYTIGVDGDNNLYVSLRHPAQLVPVSPEYRLFRKRQPAQEGD